MENYRKLVKKLADEGSSDLIPNGGVEHAEVLIENIFYHAKNTVRVFTGRLNARVYGAKDIVDNAKEFLQLDKNNKLQILIQEYSDDDLKQFASHNLITMCKEQFDDMCEIKAVNDADDKNVDSHFVVMDEIGYRFEPNKEKPTAIGCFNDAEKAKILNQMFDKMFERGKDLEFAQ